MGAPSFSGRTVHTVPWTDVSEMPRYKWSHPIEWLEHKIDQPCLDERRPPSDQVDALDAKIAWLSKLAKDLASKLDGDTLQDLFQEEMAEDGYFDDQDEEKAEDDEY